MSERVSACVHACCSITHPLILVAKEFLCCCCNCTQHKYTHMYMLVVVPLMCIKAIITHRVLRKGLPIISYPVFEAEEEGTYLTISPPYLPLLAVPLPLSLSSPLLLPPSLPLPSLSPPSLPPPPPPPPLPHSRVEGY